MTDEEIAAAPNANVQAHSDRVERFVEALRQETNTKSVAETILADAVAAVRDLLDAAKKDGVDPRQADDAWGKAAELSSFVAARGVTSIADVLLAASTRREPAARDQEKIDLLNRTRGEARTECVRGLISLAAQGSAEGMAAIVRLAQDPEPAIRCRIAGGVFAVASLSDDVIWSLAETLMRDVHPSVVNEAIHGMPGLYPRDRGRTLALVIEALERQWPSAQEGLREEALRQVAWFAIGSGDDTASACLQRVLGRLVEYTKPLGRILHFFRGSLTYVDRAGNAAVGNQVRARAWKLFFDVAAAAISRLDSGPDRTNANARLRADRPPVSELIEDVAQQIYFASGAFESSHVEKLEGARLTTFWNEGRELIKIVGTAGVMTAGDRVLETLEHLLGESDRVPMQDVFVLFLSVAESAIRFGYDQDWNGMDVIDRVLRRCLAERPKLLSDAGTLDVVSRIVDAFLNAGWYRAYLLARDLDLS